MNVNVDSLCERLDRLKTDRSDFESLWQRVADLVMPTKGNFTVKRMPGERNTNMIFDSTPTTSVNLLAAGLHGMVTNPSVQWFALTLDKSTLKLSSAYTGAPFSFMTRSIAPSIKS